MTGNLIRENRFEQPLVSETTIALSERSAVGRQTRRPTGDPDKARAILGAWQSASFRGYLTVERRADRRLVVLTLIASLLAEEVPIRGLIIAADELARAQWQQLLVRDGQALEGWTAQTPVEVLADCGVVDAGCIVVADELQAYLTEDFASALTGSCAVLGLCSSPGALGEAQHLRRYVGKALVPRDSIPHLDFRRLLASIRGSAPLRGCGVDFFCGGAFGQRVAAGLSSFSCALRLGLFGGWSGSGGCGWAVADGVAPQCKPGFRPGPVGG